jgi:hypothetical protein
MWPAPVADSSLVPAGLAWVVPMNSSLLSAAQAGVSFVAEKVSQADIQGGHADVVGKADTMMKDSVLPTTGAGLTLAKEKISQVHISAMAGSVHAAEGAMSIAKDHISQIDVQGGIANAVGKSREIIAVAGPAAEKVSPYTRP